MVVRSSTTAIRRAAHAELSVRTWAGFGSPIVAVHDVDGHGGSFQALADTIGRDVTIWAPDLRGRGDSEPSEPWGVVAHAEDLSALIGQHLFTERDTGPVVVVGHGLGAHVAARVAGDFPELVQALVLVDGGAPRQPGDDHPRDVAKAAMEAAAARLPTLRHTVDAGAVAADLASMIVSPAGAGGVFEAQCPVHLVRAGHGERLGDDPIVPDAVVERLRNGGVHVANDVVMPDATHHSLLGEHVAAVELALRAALPG